VNDEELAAHIAQVLEIDHQFVVRADAAAAEQITRLRSAGRKAGRILGWKIRTFVRELDAGSVVVGVLVIESTPDDAARLRERGDLLIREAMTDNGGDPPT
jgi:hypothetical protein